MVGEEGFKLDWILEVEGLGEEAASGAVGGGEDAVHGIDKGWHEEGGGAGDATADDHKAVDKGHGLGDGVADGLAEAAVGFAGGCSVASGLAEGDPGNDLGIGGIFEGDACGLGEKAAETVDGCALLYVAAGLELVAQEADFHAGGVVAEEKVAIADEAATETGAEGDAHEIAVAPGATGLLEEAIDVREEALEGFAVGEEVAVIVDEDGNAEVLLEHRAEGDAATEAGEIREVADDAAAVIGGAGEGEADGNRRGGEALADLLEALDDIVEAVVEFVSFGGDAGEMEKEFTTLDGRKLQERATGVQSHDCGRIGHGWSFILNVHPERRVCIYQDKIP